ncbi:PREDICTED: MYCBP-associated protein [Nanorana parkeri]|uniref:MYCBP-associated protein n=1 Tax=Nanorana parkeri TaxID=125878 RepID=UPI000854602B|nr:PREDICTED: MYCBP-associated protein [Nanorana parkeri]
MANKPGKKEFPGRSPPEKRKSKVNEQPTPPVPIELSDTSTSSTLTGDEIQSLAIRFGDLEKLHLPRRPKEEQKSPVANRVLIRKHHDKEESRKRHLLVARPAPQDSSSKGQTFSGMPLPLSATHGQLQPHNILGSLQELRKEATARGNLQIAELVSEWTKPDFLNLGTHDETGRLQQKDIIHRHHNQDNALLNWQHHMTLRKRQLDSLSRRLGKPSEQLAMNICDDYRSIQEERHAIDRCIPALESGKGYRIGSEFWNVPERIGDELSGLTITLTQHEHGYPLPITHIGKPSSIKQETGLTERPPYYNTWDKSLYFQHRRHELKAIMEELNFTKPDIDGLEVVGRGRPFSSVSAKHFPLVHEQLEETLTEDKENLDPLQDYPDVVEDFVLGPSLLFCGQPAAWVEDPIVSHRDKAGISTRITFEALAGEKASSVIEVVNNGSAAVWYEWRRLPNTTNLKECRNESRVQRFYFNTNAGVILPGETQTFPFHFKSPTAGIFGESWEFCTHPVLLAGALIQVSLWGISLYEDKTALMREELQREMKSQEAKYIAQKILQEIMNGVRSLERPQSPPTCVTEEEMFHLMNPELHYKNQTVQELQQLWREYISPGTQTSAVLPQEAMDPVPVISYLLEQNDSEAKEEASLKWNLSVVHLKQASDVILEDERQETFLFHVNRLVSELTTPALESSVDMLQQACLQLWRDAIDKLVERSMELRFVLGMPDKDVTTEFVIEETVVDLKHGKAGKDEKRTGGMKDDKKTPKGRDREEKKGGKHGGKDRLEKEDRPSSRKLKGKEDKKSSKTTALSGENKELVSSGDSLDLSPPQSRLCQVDPIIQEKYQESLYTELYGILVSVAQDFVAIAEDLKSHSTPSGNLDTLESFQYIIPQ